MGLLLRRVKGSKLTHDELDNWAAEEINQSSHGFAVGNLVYRDSATTWAKAVASAEATLADGMVVAVEDVDNCSVATKEGTCVTISAHGLGIGPPLPPLFLDQTTPGTMTTTIPDDGWIQRVGKVIDTNTVLFKTGPQGTFL